MLKKHFVNFRFDGGEYYIAIEYEHEEDLTLKIREAFVNYKWNYNDDYEDGVANVMNALNVKKWTIIYNPTINVKTE